MPKMHILDRGRLNDRESKVIDAPLGLEALGDAVDILEGAFGAADGRTDGRSGHMRQVAEIKDVDRPGATVPLSGRHAHRSRCPQDDRQAGHGRALPDRPGLRGRY